jgi:hypothetical protein
MLGFFPIASAPIASTGIETTYVSVTGVAATGAVGSVTYQLIWTSVVPAQNPNYVSIVPTES